MNPLDYLTDLNHHAYLITAVENTYHKLVGFLKKEFGISDKQNPDFFHESYEVLGIDESRRIKELHSSKSFIAGSRRIFIIETKGITHEAQNSLLKIFEEPHENTHFFIIMPSASVLLPTLRSRLLIITSKETEQPGLTEALAFLKLSPKGKVDFVDDLAKKISDEELEKSDAIVFLSALETLVTKNGVEKNQKALKAILKARDYMSDRSPSIKQLLEYVALSF